MALEQAKTHKLGYPIITGSIALAMTAEEFATLAPAQRGFVNRHRRLSGVEPFARPDIAAGGVQIEVKDQLARSVEQAREEDRAEPEVVKAKKPAKEKKPAAKRKGLFGRKAS
ncbi:hypothetical protein [Methyloceanibacter sp.]|uniref:hypothetical protein n=1 Tax=Methyloceanibacter sp. TaxID=1965321 RepID=UPI003D6C7B50